MKLSYMKRFPIMLQLSLLGLFIVAVMLSIMAANYYSAINVVKGNNSDYIKGVISQLNQSIPGIAKIFKELFKRLLTTDKPYKTICLQPIQPKG